MTLDEFKCEVCLGVFLKSENAADDVCDDCAEETLEVLSQQEREDDDAQD